MKILRKFFNEYKIANIVLVCSIILAYYFISKMGKILTCRYLCSLSEDAFMRDNNFKKNYNLEEYIMEKNLEYCFK